MFSFVGSAFHAFQEEPREGKNPEKGREVAAPSNIKEIQEVQGGQEAPHDGGVIILKDA